MEIDILNHDGQRIAGIDCNTPVAEIRIGRDEGNDIVLSGEDISPKHAIIHIAPAKISIKDTRSINGVMINGKRIGRRPVLLKTDDSILLNQYTIKLSGEFPSVKLGKMRPGKVRRTPLLAAFFVLLACLVGLMVVKEKGGDTGPASAPIETDTQTPEPDPLLLDLKENMDLFENGTEAYFNNNIDCAANLFRKVMNTYPQTFLAKEFLTEIQETYLDLFLKNGYSALKKGEMNDAQIELDHLNAIAPNNPQVILFGNLISGQKQYNEAVIQVHQGDLAQARTLLKDAQIYKDANRMALLGYVDRVHAYISIIQQIRDTANRLDYAGAMQLVEKGFNIKVLPINWKKQLTKTRNSLRTLISFQNALMNADYYRIAVLGEQVLKDPIVNTWPRAGAKINQQLADCRKEVEPQTDTHWAAAQTHMKKAEELNHTGDIDAVGKALRQAIEELTIVQFSKPSSRCKKELDDTHELLSKLVKETDQLAYVLRSKGRLDESRKTYRIVLNIAPFNSPYAHLAKKQLTELLAHKASVTPASSSAHKLNLSSIQDIQFVDPEQSPSE